MIGPFGAQHARGSGQAGRIKWWASVAFGLDVGTTMTVAELRCMEPGCPPVETVVAILDAPSSPRRSPQQYKIHKPMSEVIFEDVERLAVSEGEVEVLGTREEA